ncbi:MAG TPA: GAF domain-containing protein, partial [Chthoniobacterales bacterium]|nr:GAF domain-containing protein [Chthoniobacterales bacterium]
MNSTQISILYTQDADLVRRVKAFLRKASQVCHVADPGRLEPVLHQTGPAVLMMDLRAKECRELLEQIRQEQPDVLIIALGVAQSEPLREVEQLGVYVAEDLGLERRRFQSMLERAFAYQKILLENRDLREASTITRGGLSSREPMRSTVDSARTLPLLRFPRVLRRLDDMNTLVTSIVEAVADAAGVGRVGLFLRARESEPYHLVAGLRCLPETSQLEVSDRDALVRWFQLNARLISRKHLFQAQDQHQKAMMRRSLDLFGAELIVPLHARNGIIGWIFFGHRVTGQPFEDRDLEELTLLSEHVSTILENALLYGEAAMEKTLAETLLKSIPPGIVAVDTAAMVRWFNPRAEKIFGFSGSEALNQPIERVDNKLAGLLREALESKIPPPTQHWIDSNSRRSLSVDALSLASNGSALGAVAVITDLTAQETLREKQVLVDRAAFWTDLAASMSHEIRNPLVAIKTF